jgi:hypothetical protein
VKTSLRATSGFDNAITVSDSQRANNKVHALIGKNQRAHRKIAIDSDPRMELPVAAMPVLEGEASVAWVLGETGGLAPYR